MSKNEGNAQKLQVYFLGDIRLVYNGKEIILRFGKSTKAMQLLTMLLYSYPDGLSSDDIIDKLFRDDDIINPKGNLKVYISQLRKEVTSLGLDGPNCIVYSSGKYYWTDYAVPEVDTRMFEAMIRDALMEKSPEIKSSKYRKALEIYNGDFLSEMSGIDWVEERVQYYREIAFDATDALYDI